ncbi:cell division protein FtsK, partial [Candidatus Fermentibacteria bacterium]
MVQATRKGKTSKQQGALSGTVGFRLREAALILALAIAGYLLLSLLSYQPTDPGWSTTGSNDVIANSGGIVGAWLTDTMFYGFGYMGYLAPLMLAFSGWLLFRWGDAVSEDALHFWVMKLTGLLMALAAGSGLATLNLNQYAELLPMGAGGVLGEVVGNGFLTIFGTSGTSILLLAVLLTGVTLFTGLSWLKLVDRVGALAVMGMTLIARKVRGFQEKMMAKQSRQQREAVFREEKIKVEKREKVRVEPVLQVAMPSIREEKEKQEPLFKVVDEPGGEGVSLPALALLDLPEESKGAYSVEVLQALSRQVELKLKDFGVEVQVTEVQPGPVVTRFELQPAAGVKASRITGLAKDLARSLSVSSVRIVEVIPGKPVVGLEIPNETRDMVRLREILGCEEYEASKSPLIMALGKDIAGRPMVANLEKMPHLLVAGTTGSGKSVAVNAMILSLLYKATPEEVRLIMIDPKMLELSVYEGIPHLLTPVVTDMKEAANALRWCVAEMERRYPL